MRSESKITIILCEFINTYIGL